MMNQIKSLIGYKYQQLHILILLFISLAFITSCMSKGAYEAKTPCVFFKRDIQMIIDNPCDFRPVNMITIAHYNELSNNLKT